MAKKSFLLLLLVKIWMTEQGKHQRGHILVRSKHSACTLGYIDRVYTATIFKVQLAVEWPRAIRE